MFLNILLTLSLPFPFFKNLLLFITALTHTYYLKSLYMGFMSLLFLILQTGFLRLRYLAFHRYCTTNDISAIHISHTKCASLSLANIVFRRSATLVWWL